MSSLSLSVFFPNRIREFEARIIFQTSKHPKEERRILDLSCCYSSKSKRKTPAFSLFLVGDRSLRGMERERRVNPDCVNASNPFHVCAEYCVQRVHVLKPRSPRPKLGLCFPFLFLLTPFFISSLIWSALFLSFLFIEHWKFELCSCCSSKWAETWRGSRDGSCRKKCGSFVSQRLESIPPVCRVLLS